MRDTSSNCIQSNLNSDQTIQADGGDVEQGCFERSERLLFPADDRNQLEQIVDAFGVEPQIEMAIEEMAELVVELQHEKRDRTGGDDVVEEIADVILICHQLASIYGWHDVHDVVAFKLRQCNHRVETGDWNANLDEGGESA